MRNSSIVSSPKSPRNAVQPEAKVGVLLMNIGTPASTSTDDVRDYLSRFLGDDRVLDIEPGWLKWIVLQALLGTRPQKSAEAYKAIWDQERGSPLQFHTEDLVKGLQGALGPRYAVKIGFQYSAPFIKDSLRDFADEGIEEIVLAPMFPQYASGTTGSCVSIAYKFAADMYCTPSFKVLPPFFQKSSFLAPQCHEISKVIGPKGCNVDHTLFSFHGLPVAQCSKAHKGGATCKCDASSPLTSDNMNCYRAQCHDTARRLAAALDLADGSWSVAFQSRLTIRDTVPWIGPYTDEAFSELARSGVKRLAVTAPSFTADCLETIEELGITGTEQFEEAGGEELLVVPCLNSSDEWASGLAHMVKAMTPPVDVEADARSTLNTNTEGLCPISGKFGMWRTSGTTPAAKRMVSLGVQWRDRSGGSHSGRNVANFVAPGSPGGIRPRVSRRFAEQTLVAAPEQVPGKSSSPLSRSLKEGTKVVHMAAENVRFVQDFQKSAVPKERYVEFLKALYFIYAAMEEALAQLPQELRHIDYEVVCRSEALEKDLRFHLGLPAGSPMDLGEPSPATRQYVARLKQVVVDEPHLLLAHAYSRYMGDLSGGQVLGSAAKRAYGLEGDGGSAFYQFERIGAGAQLTDFKRNYRSSLDALGLPTGFVDSIVEEACEAFILNIVLFEELDVSAGHLARARSPGEVWSDLSLRAASGAKGADKCPFLPADDPRQPQSNGKSGKKEGNCPWPFIWLHDHEAALARHPLENSASMALFGSLGGTGVLGAEVDLSSFVALYPELLW
jgi:ferrochelatase